MFDKITEAKRPALGFGLTFIMLLASVLFELNRLGNTDEIVEHIVAKDWGKTVPANDTIDLMNANTSETFLLFLTKDRAIVTQRIAANVQAISAKQPACGHESDAGSLETHARGAKPMLMGSEGGPNSVCNFRPACRRHLPAERGCLRHGNGN